MSQESLKAAFLKAVDRVEKDPLRARAQFRVETELEDDVRCVARVRQFPPLIIDESAHLGGGNAGMNPVELVLAALGACQEIMYSLHASLMGIDLQAVTVNLKGNLDLRGFLGIDPDVAPGFQSVEYETRISAGDCDQGAMSALINTVESRCPVFDMLSRPIEIKGRVFVNGSDFESTSA